MVIVTQNQYILASKIHHITMDEQVQHHEVRSSSGRYRTVIDRYFQITVIYTPELTQAQQNNSLNGRDPDQRECSVIVRGNVRAHLVFKNLIQQIREQMPDQLYLDTALERMLGGVSMDALKEKDQDELDAFDLSEEKPKKKKKIKLSNRKPLPKSRLNAAKMTKQLNARKKKNRKR